MRYAGFHNFVGRPIHGYHQPHCILTRQAAEHLHQVQQQLRPLSLSLKVYDCYRPTEAVADFANWSLQPKGEVMKKEFFPREPKNILFEKGYIALYSGHSRGSTVDLTLVKIPAATEPAFAPGQALFSCYAPHSKRFADNSIDMGTGFDCFDILSHGTYTRIGQPAYQNRLLLKRIMEQNGFVPYTQEWWHFTLKHEPFPHTFFDFPVT